MKKTGKPDSKFKISAPQKETEETKRQAIDRENIHNTNI